MDIQIQANACGMFYEPSENIMLEERRFTSISEVYRNSGQYIAVPYCTTSTQHASLQNF